MTTVNSYPADRFTSIIEELCRVLSAHATKSFIGAPLLLQIWNRVTRLSRRFASLVERVRSGTLADTAQARGRGAAERPEGSAGRSCSLAPEALPRHFGWLVNSVPELARFGGDLCWLMQRPEMAALIAEAPD